MVPEISQNLETIMVVLVCLALIAGLVALYLAFKNQELKKLLKMDAPLRTTIEKLRSGNTALSIVIEDHEETIKQLRLDHKACGECRKDTVEITATYRKKIK